MQDKDAQVNTMMDTRASNPFYVLQMEEDEDLDDEELEEIKDMQTSPARSVPKIPQRRTHKRSECEDSSVGSMSRPTKGGKLEVINVIDNVVEPEPQQMEMDVSTITDFPEDDDLLVLEDAKEDEYQYEDNSGQANMTDSKISHNQESILDSEKPPADKISVTPQETSQTSDEEEWEDTNLEEQTRAETNRKVALHAHLAVQPKQRQMSKKEETAAIPRKDNRININQEKVQCQQAARQKLLLEKRARSKQASNLDQSSTDSDTESVAESTATIHQSNTRSGVSPCMVGNLINHPRTLQQATEGVSLPVFRNTLPRKYYIGMT